MCFGLDWVLGHLNQHVIKDNQQKNLLRLQGLLQQRLYGMPYVLTSLSCRATVLWQNNGAVAWCIDSSSFSSFSFSSFIQFCSVSLSLVLCFPSSFLGFFSKSMWLSAHLEHSLHTSIIKSSLLLCGFALKFSILSLTLSSLPIAGPSLDESMTVAFAPDRQRKKCWCVPLTTYNFILGLYSHKEKMRIFVSKEH